MSNRLRTAASPYLVQHAENPVDWYPWGEEALARARAEDKPIFLSLGYAACHWCHVMAHESFEDAQTAAQMNADFVCIKVDREERPDLDAIYMDAVVGLTGSGGWPLSVFLTPNGEPFFGGTYWPPVPRHGLPAFHDVLQRVAEAWRDRREAVLQAGGEYAHALRSQPADADAAPREDDLAARAAERLFRAYDWQHGGWGGAPKFPQPLAIDFLLARAQAHHDRLGRDQAIHALTSMADGGIHDQVGGGFHRYAVDEHWTVPHFEKMLYDNALLARAYLHAWQLTGQPRFRLVLDSTLGFLLREMRHPAGGFFASLDADSDGAEGTFYIWEAGDARQALADFEAAEFALAALSLTPDGNFDGRTVLHRTADLDSLAGAHGIPTAEIEGVLAAAGAGLLEARARRTRPSCDDKIVAEWNGLTLMAMAEAGRATGNHLYRQASRELAEFLASTLIDGDRIIRTWRDGHSGPAGVLADFAALALGFLAQYQSDFDVRWYDEAERLGDSIVRRFGDASGGLYDTASDHEALIVRPRSLQDNPTPSGSSLACMLFLKLDGLTGEARWREAAEALLAQTSVLAAEHPTGFAHWLSAADLAAQPLRQLALVGPAGDPRLELLAQAAWERFEPHMVLAAGLGDRPALLRGRSMIDGAPAAYLCADFSCRMPATDPARLVGQMTEGTKGASAPRLEA